MGSKYLVNKFTAGEFDPKFLAEIDFDGYKKGARKLRNVICTPQGSAQRRFGTHFETTINIVGINITDVEKVRLIAFEYLDLEKYWLVIRTNGLGGVEIDVYLDDVFQVTVPIAGYVDTEIRNIRWVVDVNKVYLLHQNYAPRLFTRIAANNWTDAAMVFTFWPAEDFAVLDNAVNNYTNNGTTFTPNLVAATTVTASTAVFTSNHSGIAPNAGGVIIFNGGVFHINSVNAAGTIATGFVDEDFLSTAAILGSEVFLGERAWGNGAVIGAAPAGLVRGYPRHGQFFQQRLVLGGSVASPGTAYASEVKEYFNFNNSNTDASTGWAVEAGVTGTDTITDIMSVKSLVLLTNKGSSATSILLDLPTTPTNVFLNTQGTEGSRNMDGVMLDNQVLYADRAGNTIWSMTYDVPDTGYSVMNASILSAHLIRNPRWADIFDPDNVDGRYYLLVNSDGTMAMYNSIVDQNIHAWTMGTTLGSFTDVACLGNTAKVLVKRQIITGGATVGPLQAIYTVDDTFSVFRNITVAINTPVNTTVFGTDGDYILIGNEIPFTDINITFNTAASQSINPTFEFLTNTGDWETFSPTDTTIGCTINGHIMWLQSDVSNWEAQPLTDTDASYHDYPSYYWMRIKRVNSVAITAPIVSSMFINTESIICLERLDFDIYMDSQINTTSDGTGLVLGLASLAGQNAFVFANGFPLGTFYIPDSGSLTIDSLDAEVWVGLDYTPQIIPMPVFALLQDGYRVYQPQHIQEIFLDVYESLGVTLEAQSVLSVIPGQFMTTATPKPVSVYFKWPSYNGWDARAEIIISQSYPAPMVIRGICLIVEVL